MSSYRIVHQTSSPRERQILPSDPVIYPWPVRGHVHANNVRQIIVPPSYQQVIYPQPVTSELYRPPCPQYAGYAPGGIIRNGNSLVGTCSPNVGRDPFSPPFDFQCNSGVCVSANGMTGPTPNSVCCAPGPAQTPWWNIMWNPIPIQPRPVPSGCCSNRDVNSCAKCLDNLQGLSSQDAAGHFNNMNTCKNTCGRY
jgi:hypothetical protein